MSKFCFSCKNIVPDDSASACPFCGAPFGFTGTSSTPVTPQPQPQQQPYYQQQNTANPQIQYQNPYNANQSLRQPQPQTQAGGVKCPNCGANIGNGTVCQYCGSQISYAMKREQEQLNKSGCPKCGSSNIQFKRENHGEYRDSNSKQIIHRTVGFCKDCGFTWYPNAENEGPKKNYLVWWILGWVFFFPAPVMVLIWRKKNTWKLPVKITVTVAFWLLFIIIGSTGSSSDTSTTTERSSTVAEESTYQEKNKETKKGDTGNPDKLKDKKKAESNKTVPKVEEEAPPESNEITIDEQVILNQEGIKVTATGLGESWMGPELQLLVENDTSQPLTFQVRNANVNGYMVDSFISEDVAPGKKSNTEISFTTTGLKDCGITTFANIQFSFEIFNSDTWDTVLKTDVISIDTSAAATYTQVYDDSGTVFYDKDGIKIIGKELSHDDSFFGPGLIIYIENNTGTDFTVQARDTSVNGFMIDTAMSTDVAAGKKALSAVTFLNNSLEKNGITDIETVETSFVVFDMTNWEDIAETDVIKVSF